MLHEDLTATWLQNTPGHYLLYPPKNEVVYANIAEHQGKLSSPMYSTFFDYPTARNPTTFSLSNRPELLKALGGDDGADFEEEGENLYHPESSMCLFRRRELRYPSPGYLSPALNAP